MYIDTKIEDKFARISVERCLVICHGLPYESGSVIDKSYYDLAKFFSEFYPTLIFDFRGTGNSGGKFSLKSWVEDIIGIGQKFKRIILLGYSMGGAVAVKAACELNNVEKLITVASPCCSDMFTENTLKAIYENAVSKNVLHGLDDFKTFQNIFLTEFEEIKPIKWIGKIKVPKLFVHGMKDTIVPFKHSKKLFELAKDPKTFITIINGDHFLRRNEKVSELILDWLEGKIKENIDIMI